jgi:hypothetical protein
VKERKGLRVKVWFIALMSILVAFGGLSLFVIQQKLRLGGLESSIAALKQEYLPLRFQVVARSGGGIETKMKFYDAEGKLISTAEHSMKGESLFLDFISVPVGKSYLAFPKAAFTEAIPAQKGESLFSYYDRDGFPEIFAAQGLDRKTRDALTALFFKIKLGQQPGASFGNAVHDVKEFKKFEIGTVYKVVARQKGGIEILEDDE